MFMVWDAAVGSRLRALRVHFSPVHCVSWSRDCSVLVSCSAEFSVRMWDAVTGTHKRSLKGHTRVVNAVVWSLDLSLLATCGQDKMVRLWDAGPVQTPAAHALRQAEEVHTVHSVAWGACGSVVFAGTSIMVLDTAGEDVPGVVLGGVCVHKPSEG